MVVSGARSWTQDSAGVAGGAEAGDLFGVSVGSLDLQPSDENGGNNPDPDAHCSWQAHRRGHRGAVDAGAVLSLGENRWYDEAHRACPGLAAGRPVRRRLGAARDFEIDAPGPVPGRADSWSASRNATGDGAVVVGLPNKRVTADTLLTPPAPDGLWGGPGSTR